MKSRATRILIARLSHWQSRVPDLQLFAKFMTLAARVLFHKGIDVCTCLRTRVDRTRIARDSGALETGAAIASVVSGTCVRWPAHVRVVPPPPALFTA